MPLVTKAECVSRLHRSIEKELILDAVFDKFEAMSSARVLQRTGLSASTLPASAPAWSKNATILLINYYASQVTLLNPSDNILKLQQLWKSDAEEILDANKIAESRAGRAFTKTAINTGWEF